MSLILQEILFPDTIEFIGNITIDFVLESEYIYLSADSYQGDIRLQLFLSSDYSYSRSHIGHLSLFLILQSDYAYIKLTGNKLILSLSLNSDYSYTSSKLGHLTIRLELDSLYTMHGLPITGKVKLSLFPISDYVFIQSKIGKIRINFIPISDCYYLDAFRWISRAKVSFNFGSDYIYIDSIQSNLLVRFILNSDTYCKDADNVFRALIFGIKSKFKLESNIGYGDGEIQPIDLIPDENDLRHLQSMVEFIYDIDKLDEEDAVDLLIPVQCIIENPDLTLINIPVTCIIYNPLCIEDIPVTCIIVSHLDDYYTTEQEPGMEILMGV